MSHTIHTVLYEVAVSSAHLQGFRKRIDRLDLESNLCTVLMCARSGGKALVVKRKVSFCLFLSFLSFTFYFLLGIVCT